jgi:hypothetical protein
LGHPFKKNPKYSLTMTSAPLGSAIGFVLMMVLDVVMG